MAPERENSNSAAQLPAKGLPGTIKASVSAKEEKADEELPLDPTIDITRTRGWLHPTNPEANMTFEGHILYNNLTQLARQVQSLALVLQQHIGMTEKRERDRERRASSASRKKPKDEAEDKDDLACNASDRDFQSFTTGRRSSNASTRSTSGTRKASVPSGNIKSDASALLDEKETFLLEVYKDWIEIEKNTVRKIRVQNGTYLQELQKFLTEYLPSHAASSHEAEWISEVQSKDQGIQVELFLQLGQKFATKEPEIAQLSTKRKPVEPKPRPKRQSTSSAGPGRQESIQDGGAPGPLSNSTDRPQTRIHRRASSKGTMRQENAENFDADEEQPDPKVRSANRENDRTGKIGTPTGSAASGLPIPILNKRKVSINIGEGEVRHPASSMTDASSEPEQPRKRLRDRNYQRIEEKSDEGGDNDD